MKRVLVLGAMLLLAGCQGFATSTAVESVQSQPASPATLKKILILGVNTTDELRLALEQAFVRQLAPAGHEVIPSAAWYPDGKLPTRDVIAERVRAEGVTGVLITRLEGYQEIPVKEAPALVLFTPSRSADTRVGWYQDPWMQALDRSVADRAPLVERQAQVVTRLYDVTSGQVVWEAHSTTVLEKGLERDANGFVTAIVRSLRKSGWR
ncbi:MAG: hypothetical protein Q8J78_14445 [Moraxellaceae bacterium]|nr:hypothetical protein [Moraxellaceae bacterium]